jgi:antitoxin YefM
MGGCPTCRYHARILHMETRPLAEVRQDLSRFIDRAVTTHERFDITRNGKRAAVLLSADDYDSLLETLDILGDADLVRDIREALAEAESGDVVSHEQVMSDLAARRTGR